MNRNNKHELRSNERKFVLSKMMGPQKVFYLKGDGDINVYTTIENVAHTFPSQKAAEDYRATNWLFQYKAEQLI
jgi:hypothetical protein